VCTIKYLWFSFILRSIICTSAFGEFTEKQLRSTYSQLALMTRNKLPDNILNDHDVRLLEDFCTPENLFNTESADLGNRRGVAVSCGSGKNILHVRIRSACNNDKNSEVVKTSENINCSDFNGIGNLSPSFHCYQIPLIYKGIHLSSKQKLVHS